MGFLLSKSRKKDINCRFCSVPDGDGHLFWKFLFPPIILNCGIVLRTRF